MCELGRLTCSAGRALYNVCGAFDKVLAGLCAGRQVCGTYWRTKEEALLN